MRLFFIKLILFTFFTSGISQEILPLKSRAEIIDKIQKDRLDNLLPQLMSKSNLDMWVLITREYNVVASSFLVGEIYGGSRV